MLVTVVKLRVATKKNTYKNLGQFDVSNYWLIVDVKHVMMDVVDVFDVDSGDPW